MEKMTFNLTDEQLAEIEKCFENEDVIELKRICIELGVELEEIKTFDTMSYKLLECIESNDELVEKLREISKERKGLKKLLPYYQKPENMRYFVDHKEEYHLNNIELNKMEKLYISRRFRDLDKEFQNRDKFWRKNGFKITVVLELLLVLFTYNFFLKQYFITSIFKKAEITDAVILESSLDRYARDYYTLHGDIKYEYNVDNKKYVNEEKNVIFAGIGETFKNVYVGNSIKIYYEKENPAKAKVYQDGKVWSITFIMTSILIIVVLLRLIFWNK